MDVGVVIVSLMRLWIIGVRRLSRLWVVMVMIMAVLCIIVIGVIVLSFSLWVAIVGFALVVVSVIQAL